MQSILQYRSFERRLRQQIDRHGLDSTSGATTSHDDAHSSLEKTSSTIPPAPTEARDYALEEKELQSNGLSEASVTATSHVPPPTNVSGPVDSTNDNGDTPLSGSTTRDSSSTSSSVPSLHRSQLQLGTLSNVTTHETDAGAHLGQALTGINVRTRKTNEGGKERGQVFIVGYSGDNDPLNPHNWTILKRMCITLLVASVGLIVGFASSVDSAALQQAMKEFNVSEVVESLATGIYLVGFGLGAFFAAPHQRNSGQKSRLHCHHASFPDIHHG